MQAITEFFQIAPVGECMPILDFWLYECSIEDAPDRNTVQQWQQLFLQRSGKFNRLADLCLQWLNEETA